MSYKELERMLERASAIELDEGMVAYQRYHIMMERMSQRRGRNHNASR